VGKRLVPENVVGLIEVHIEQGPGMWKRDERLAVVTGIAGRRQYKCTVDGVANHAGSTSMEDRKDALAGAATLVLQLEGLARGLGEGTVMTVGRIECRPNAINVVPERVEFTIDFRSADNAVLAEGDKRIRELVAQVAERRGLKTLIERTEDAAAVGMDPRVVDALRRSAGGIGFGDLPTATSGALHDAAVLAAHVPTAMLFVPSRDGISHNPGEFSRAEDVMLAARVLEETVRTTVVE
jgi:allantoate deiminase